MLQAIAYLSTAAPAIDVAALEGLLDDARAFNKLSAVTGVLLYDNETFFQYIEGPNERIHLVYERIRLSRMHSRIYELLNTSVDEREFSDWSMGFLCPPKSVLLELSHASWLTAKKGLDAAVRPKSDGVLFLLSFVHSRRSAT